MRIQRKFALLTAIMFFLTMACFSGMQPPKPGDTLILDDFSDLKGNWDTWEERDNTTVTYYHGGLIMVINAPNRDVLTTHIGSYRDVAIEATAQKLTGPDDNAFGLVCRYQDMNNYYALIISSDGYYGIVKVIQGAYHLISGNNLNYDERIRQGNAENLIQAECQGNEIALTVNGDELVRVQDSDLETGRTGLITGTYEEAGAAILFDHFVVKTP